MARQDAADALQLLGRVQIQGITHDTERRLVDRKRDAVTVEDLPAGRGNPDQPQPIVVGQANVFVAMEDLKEIKTAQQ